MLRTTFLITLSILINLTDAFAETETVATIKKTEAGSVHSIEGELFVEQGRSRRTLKTGDPVFEGDFLRTGEKSKAQIKLGKEAAVLMNANTKLLVTKTKEKGWFLRLKEGALLSFYKNKGKGDEKEPFKVQSRSSVIGVRGTTFFVNTETGKEDYFCACNGKVSVKTKSSKQLITTQHHDAPKYVSETGEIKATEDKTGHNDQQIDELKSIVK